MQVGGEHANSTLERRVRSPSHREGSSVQKGAHIFRQPFLECSLVNSGKSEKCSDTALLNQTMKGCEGRGFPRLFHRLTSGSEGVPRPLVALVDKYIVTPSSFFEKTLHTFHLLYKVETQALHFTLKTLSKSSKP